MTQQLSRGDLLALIDRAASVVGEVEEPTDPIAPGMLCTDAIVLLDQLARRTAGVALAELVHWQRRNAWKCRHKSSAPELRQLAEAQANSRAAVQNRANAFARRVAPVIREIQEAGVHTP